MGLSHIWATRLAQIQYRVTELLFVGVIYLMSEVIIWGLSRLLAPAQLEYLSSLLGMLIVFTVVSIAYLGYRRCDRLYEELVKPKIDFINSNLGVGFPVPIVMLDERSMLKGRKIASIMGSFVITNIVSWTACFVIAYASMLLLGQVQDKMSKSLENESIAPSSRASSVCPLKRYSFWQAGSQSQDNDDAEKGTQSDESQSINQQPSNNRASLTEEPEHSTGWQMLMTYYPILLALFCALVIGGPVLSATGDSRFLDGCVVWFIWISALHAQKLFKTSAIGKQTPRIKNTLVTIMNPVLITTLLLLGYTRARAAATQGADVIDILGEFSQGTPLYNIWTSSVTQTPLPDNPSRWFGAGDAALSILECGILIWGFKLYECRRQLFSAAGLVTVVISIAAAAGNVYLSVLTGHALGLDQPEALAFAARSTTLALAKPAIEAVGGNLAVNAALVVSNGILGQLMYPFAPTLLGITKPKTGDAATSSDGEAQPSNAGQAGGLMSNHESEDTTDDQATTIAAGIAVGINGAAMGVAYLYESKSRAAPYAALAMTVFGVMTVVFTTVQPFEGAVLYLENL